MANINNMWYFLMSVSVNLYVEILADNYNPHLTWDVCSPSRVIVTLSGAADGGIIYIRGYGAACKQETTPNVTQHEFEFAACGIQNAETYFTIIVQRNPLYQTGADLQESLFCIFDLSDISVASGTSVTKDDDAGINKTVRPTATMGLFKAGSDVSGSEVKLTDVITMAIQLDEEFIQDFDIKARSCTANYIDIVQESCSVDSALFPMFSHPTQGALTSSFSAFRTTDLSGGSVEMTFSCTVQVCLGACQQSNCDPVNKRRKRDVTNSATYDDINVGAGFQIGASNVVNKKDISPEDTTCISTSVIIIAAIIVLILVGSSAAGTIFVTRKLLSRTEELHTLKGTVDIQRETINRKLNANALCKLYGKSGCLEVSVR